MFVRTTLDGPPNTIGPVLNVVGTVTATCTSPIAAIVGRSNAGAIVGVVAALCSSPAASVAGHITAAITGTLAASCASPVAAAAGESLPQPPSVISNLTLWLDGHAATFSDTGGTTPATSPAGRVRRIDQPAPLTGAWLASSDPVRPFRENLGLHVPFSTSLAAPVGATIPANDSTIAASFVMRDSGASSGLQPLLIGFDGVSNHGVAVFGGQVLIYREGTFWSTGINLPQLASVELVARFTSGGAKLSCVINGVLSPAAESATISTRTVGSMVMGTGLGQFLHALVTQLIVYGRALTDAEVTNTLLPWLAACRAPVAMPLDAPLFITIGDSIDRNFGVDSWSGWNGIMPKNLWATAPVRLLNFGVSGHTIAQMQADYIANGRPQFSASRSKNVCILAGGTNSISTGGGGLTAAQALTQIYSLADLIRADGFKVIIQPIDPRSDVPFGNAPYEATRTAYNADLLLNGPAHSDAIANIETVSGMSAAGDSDNLTNYQDKVHWTAVGHGLKEPVYRAASLLLIP